MSSIFFFSFVFSLVSCAHAHGAPHAEALPSEPETRVPSVRRLQEPPRLGTVCRNAAQVTKLKAAAAVGREDALSTELWSWRSTEVQLPGENSGPQPTLPEPRESSPAHCLWGKPRARAGSHNLFIL